ncbi:MAG: metal ABC transporter permease [Deltaproteobacteria bacterium]|nr:metal ABC transporter permease [Deltaproteobacteria bacterium]
MDLAAPLLDYTVRTVTLGTAAVGAVGGVLGAFAVLRRQGLLGDAVSHAALPGVALAFLLTGSKDLPVLAAGAAIAGWAGSLVVLRVVRSPRVKEDAGLGIVLSTFFGLGLVLLTFIQRSGDAAQAGLDRFLFGQAATLLESDVRTVTGVGAVAIVLVLLLWKEFKLVSFDPGFAAGIGLPVRALDTGLTLLTVAAVVIGLQSVGVVLMSAVLVAPAAAARQWTDRLGPMVWISAGFGAASGAAGALLSSTVDRLPTGPAVVLCATAIAAASLAFAPRRGLAWAAVAAWQRRRRIHSEAVLIDMLALESGHATMHHADENAHSAEVLRLGRAGVDPRRTLALLAARGLVRAVGGGFALTDAGRDEAARLRGGDGGAR